MSSFTSIPVLDLSLSKSESTKPSFLEDLKKALLEVGFLYIKNTGIDEKLTEDVIRLGKAFFELPAEEKLRLEMKNSPHFLGYSRLGNEITKRATDWREQIDLATELPAPGPNEPRYRKLRGPNQWPKEELLPGFRETYTKYIDLMGDLSTEFTGLIAEAIGLPSEAFQKFFDGIGESESGTRRQDKLKIVKYPDLAELGEQSGGSNQGVGPHKDSMLSSYLLQAPPHQSLQVQNAEGAWVSCPPIDGTLVVALGQGLEAVTGGVVTSTTHRVLSPKPGEGPRISIPFFQGISYDAAFESMEVPEEVRKLKKEIIGNDVEMTFRKDMFMRLGEATLMNRVKSHPDVGEKFYPDLLAKWCAQVAQETKLSPSGKFDGSADAQPVARRRAPTIVLEKTPGPPGYGEDPGPNGSLERKEAYEMRKMDATPDQVRITLDGTTEQDTPKPMGRRRAPTIVLEKLEGPAGYGEDPGPNGSVQRKEAYEVRKMDATPDEVRVVKE